MYVAIVVVETSSSSSRFSSHALTHRLQNSPWIIATRFGEPGNRGPRDRETRVSPRLCVESESNVDTVNFPAEMPTALCHGDLWRKTRRLSPLSIAPPLFHRVSLLSVSVRSIQWYDQDMQRVPIFDNLLQNLGTKYPILFLVIEFVWINSTIKRTKQRVHCAPKVVRLGKKDTTKNRWNLDNWILCIKSEEYSERYIYYSRSTTKSSSSSVEINSKRVHSATPIFDNYIIVVEAATDCPILFSSSCSRNTSVFLVVQGTSHTSFL